MWPSCRARAQQLAAGHTASRPPSRCRPQAEQAQAELTLQLTAAEIEQERAAAAELLCHQEALSKLTAYQLEAVQVLEFAALAEKLEGELTFSADAAAAAVGAGPCLGLDAVLAADDWLQAPPPLALHQAQQGGAADTSFQELDSPVWLEQDELEQLLQQDGGLPGAAQPLGAASYSGLLWEPGEQLPAAAMPAAGPAPAASAAAASAHAAAPAASGVQPSGSRSQQSVELSGLSVMEHLTQDSGQFPLFTPQLPGWLLR